MDKRYPFQHVKVLDQYNRAEDSLQRPWKNSKNDPAMCRNTMIDFIQKTHKKSGKLAPSQYWKPSKKGDYPDLQNRTMCQASV